MAMPGKGKGGGQDSGRDPEPPDQIRALNHRARRRILRFLHVSEGPSSPVRIAKALSLPLSTVGYHVRILTSFQALKEVDRQQVRGSIEHFYESTVEGDETIQAMLERTRDTDER